MGDARVPLFFHPFKLGRGRICPRRRSHFTPSTILPCFSFVTSPTISLTSYDGGFSQARPRVFICLNRPVLSALVALCVSEKDRPPVSNLCRRLVCFYFPGQKLLRVQVSAGHQSKPSRRINNSRYPGYREKEGEGVMTTSLVLYELILIVKPRHEICNRERIYGVTVAGTGIYASSRAVSASPGGLTDARTKTRGCSSDKMQTQLSPAFSRISLLAFLGNVLRSLQVSMQIHANKP